MSVIFLVRWNRSQICVTPGVILFIASVKMCIRDRYEAVRELGMEYIQGYYFGRPMSARQFEDRLKE